MILLYQKYAMFLIDIKTCSIQSLFMLNLQYKINENMFSFPNIQEFYG